MIRRHTCFRCCGLFEQGDFYYSDAPNIIYHLKCFIAEVKS